MEFLILLIPLVIWLFIIFLKKDHDSFTFGSITIGISLFIIAGMSISMRKYNFSDTEYLSYYITKIRHTDRWNEYIHRTCTERVAVGRDKDGNTIYKTREYDCSYVENHPERWLKYDNLGGETYIDKSEFLKIQRSWNTPMVFIDMNRHYHTIDGDAQDYYWDKSRENAFTYSKIHKYENRILGSQSVLKYKNIDKKEAKELGLYDYPIFPVGGELNPILSRRKVDNKDQKVFQFINGYYGYKKQFKCFILKFDYRLGVGISEDQKAYWQGGNKNEFVICVGVDNRDSIYWSNCFSWQETPDLDIRCRSWLLDQKYLNIKNLGIWVENNLHKWKRREFAEFNYISSFLSSGQITSILWTVIIFTILSIIGYLIYLSKYKNNRKNNYKIYRRYGY